MVGFLGSRQGLSIEIPPNVPKRLGKSLFWTEITLIYGPK